MVKPGGGGKCQPYGQFIPAVNLRMAKHSSGFLQFSQTGNPAEVLRMAARETRPPCGRATARPCIPRHEGCGQVEALGPEVVSLAKGDVVIPLLGPSSHRGRACLCQSARAQRSCAGQNAARESSNRLVVSKEFVDLEPGSWMVQLGADEVLLDTEEGAAQARSLPGGAPLRLAAYGIGGGSAARLMELLSSEGTMVPYGAMSRRSFKVPNKFLIFKNLSLRGLWVTKWFEKAGRDQLYCSSRSRR